MVVDAGFTFATRWFFAEIAPATGALGRITLHLFDDDEAAFGSLVSDFDDMRDVFGFWFGLRWLAWLLGLLLFIVFR